MNKTTIAAVVAVSVSLLNGFGFGVSKEVEDALVGVLFSAGILIALFVKSPKTDKKEKE